MKQSNLSFVSDEFPSTSEYLPVSENRQKTQRDRYIVLGGLIGTPHASSAKAALFWPPNHSHSRLKQNWTQKWSSHQADRQADTPGIDMTYGASRRAVNTSPPLQPWL